MRSSFIGLSRMLDEFIKNYEEVPEGCGYNIGAEARKKAKLERIRRQQEEMREAFTKAEAESKSKKVNKRKAG